MAFGPTIGRAELENASSEQVAQRRNKAQSKSARQVPVFYPCAAFISLRPLVLPRSGSCCLSSLSLKQTWSHSPISILSSSLLNPSNVFETCTSAVAV